ncbi:hypothetical protein E2320_017996 [Naja naja]|nr:hypothetical protein E2320_017996 [Naja naja]
MVVSAQPSLREENTTQVAGNSKDRNNGSYQGLNLGSRKQAEYLGNFSCLPGTALGKAELSQAAYSEEGQDSLPGKAQLLWWEKDTHLLQQETCKGNLHIYETLQLPVELQLATEVGITFHLENLEKYFERAKERKASPNSNICHKHEKAKGQEEPGDRLDWKKETDFKGRNISKMQPKVRSGVICPLALKSLLCFQAAFYQPAASDGNILICTK